MGRRHFGHHSQDDFFEDLADWLGLAFYLALGWVGTFGIFLLARRYGLGFVKLLVLGGLAYSAGAVTDLLGRPILIPGLFHAHDLSHVFILIGATLHWKFIWQNARDDFPARRDVTSSAHERPWQIVKLRSADIL